MAGAWDRHNKWLPEPKVGAVGAVSTHTQGAQSSALAKVSSGAQRPGF